MLLTLKLIGSEGGSGISEVQALFWVMMAGVSVGVIFDIYRAFRKWSGWGRFSTFLGDILFSLAALVILFIFLQKANGLDLRLYTVWGSILGLFLYLKIFSRPLVRLYLSLLGFFAWLGHLALEGLKLPYRGVVLLMRPPYALVRWVSLLFYRIGEALVMGPVKSRVRQTRNWWDRHIPPRTKG